MARNVQVRRLGPLFLILFVLIPVLTGCSGSVPVSFESNESNSNYNFMVSSSGDAGVAEAFAKDLAVMDSDVNPEALSDNGGASAVGLFDVKEAAALMVQNPFQKVYPASLTKIMTALVALKYASPDMVLTASSNVNITEPGAQLCGLQEGDTMTLDQALHIMLVYSANDAAILIAEGVGGSVDGFLQLMNDEARAIGATGTNFINSNGLSDENHYTTLYDLYLIFNEALKYSEFSEIINMSRYSTVYHNAAGQEKTLTVDSTNLYVTEYIKAPGTVTVIGGKTGTTSAAGHCLILLARNTSGNPFISVVMRAPDQATLYQVMNGILGLIPQG